MSKTAPESHVETAPTTPGVPWGPIAAIAVTAVIFFGSMFAAVICILAYARANSWNANQATTWMEDSVFGQFAYIALIEFFTLAALAVFLRSRRASFRTLGLVRPKLRDLGYAVLGLLVYFPILIAIIASLQALVPQINMDQQQQIGFEAASKGPDLLLVFISLAILPPLVEEIVFRGFLYLGIKKRLPKYWAILVTSLIFAALHLQVGNGEPLLWIAGIDTFVLSVVLIYLRNKTNSLWASILLHMFKNSFAFVSLFLIGK